MIKLSKLKTNPNNPRIIRDAKFAKLKKSIQEFPAMMALRPIIHDEDFVVLGGNMRLRVLQDLGYKEIPNEWVKSAKELTEEEKQRFVIADNVGYGEWDWEVLANEWSNEKLIEWGIDTPNFGNQEGLNTVNSDTDEWVGMPEFEKGESAIKAVISFENKEEREKFAEKYDIPFLIKGEGTWTTWFPYKQRDDNSSLRYE